MEKIGIIGAGASGLYLAANLNTERNEVTIIEKNEAIGRKILMTGGGRCNITSAKVYQDFLANINHNKKFIYSSFNSHDNFATMGFFESNGLPLTYEEEDRVFPASQKAAEVVKFFENMIVSKNIKLVTGCEVLNIEKNQRFLVKTSIKDYEFDKVIIATGGLSYPATGSTGKGYELARKFGHRVSKTYPTLVPIFFKDTDLASIRAVSLEAAEVKIKTKDKTHTTFGPILITDKFISGPAVLRASSMVGDNEVKELAINLLAHNYQYTAELVLDLIEANPTKDIINALRDLLPASLLEVVLKRAGIKADLKAGQLKKQARHKLITELTSFKLDFKNFGGFSTAVVTRGGVDVDEINPKTMESKKVSGLYFIGEVLDIDGLTGGFNLQLAFTTAHAAATSINESIKEES